MSNDEIRTKRRGVPTEKLAPIAPQMTNLLTVALAESDQFEIVVSEVVVPPGFEAPKHYHPGQEFAYVVSGAVTLKVDGQPDATYRTGEACVVPPRAMHTITAEVPARLVVFRVHDPGAPTRVIVKADGEEIPMDH